MTKQELTPEQRRLLALGFRWIAGAVVALVVAVLTLWAAERHPPGTWSPPLVASILAIGAGGWCIWRAVRCLVRVERIRQGRV